MLSYNVADLLRSAPGHQRSAYPVDVADLAIADDLRLAAPIEGDGAARRAPAAASSSRGHVDTALAEPCAAASRHRGRPSSVDIEEEALPSIDIDTGLPRRHDDGARRPAARRPPRARPRAETVREAISLAEPIAPLCRPDCPGCASSAAPTSTRDPAHRPRRRRHRPAPRSRCVGPARRELDVGRPSATSAPTEPPAQPRSPRTHGSPQATRLARRQGERRAHHALTTPQLEECPHCHQPKRSHHACPNCGWYGGREAVQDPPEVARASPGLLTERSAPSAGASAS